MKKILALFVSTLTFIFITTPAFALTIDNIGATTVPNGNPGTNWYYTSQNPRLSGTAVASSNVTITIDGTDYPVSADANGNWSYSPTTLTTGDRSISVVGDGQTMSFTLHVGQSVPSSTSTSTSTGSAQTLPVSGAVENTLMLLGGGAILIFVGWRLSAALNTQPVN